MEDISVVKPREDYTVKGVVNPAFDIADEGIVFRIREINASCVGFRFMYQLL